MKIILAGATGFVGTRLLTHLHEAGHDVVKLSRRLHTGSVIWDGRNLGPWCAELEGAGAVINLSGAPITLPWTPENKQKIIESRTLSTAILGQAIGEAKDGPKVWINASAVGIYGNRGDEVVTELSPPGPQANFLVRTCIDWEKAATDNCPSDVRLNIVRIGIVLGAEGGTMKPLTKLTRLFLGGAQGSGQQYISWIHVDDLCRLIIHRLDSTTRPIVNGTAPHPERNGIFMEKLRKTLHRPWSPPVPGIALKLVAQLGGPDSSLILDGQNAVPEVAQSTTFRYLYPSLESAFAEIFTQI